MVMDLNEIDIESIVVVKENVEIVSINVEDVDTYLVNGYVTHNKGGNTHTDESLPSAPTSLAWSNSTNTLSWSGDGTNDVYDLQVSTVSNFASTEVNETEWSCETSYVYGTPGQRKWNLLAIRVKTLWYKWFTKFI